MGSRSWRASRRAHDGPEDSFPMKSQACWISHKAKIVLIGKSGRATMRPCAVQLLTIRSGSWKTCHGG